MYYSYFQNAYNSYNRIGFSSGGNTTNLKNDRSAPLLSGSEATSAHKKIKKIQKYGAGSPGPDSSNINSSGIEIADHVSSRISGINDKIGPGMQEVTLNKSRIMIVDDHAIFRRGLGQLINEEPDMEVCGEADGVLSATLKIGVLNPDLVVVDISMKDASGFELIKYIADNKLSIPALVLSMHEETVFAERALRSGAKGYIMKHEMSDNITDAIRELLEGNIYISEAIHDKIHNSVSI